MAPRTIVEPVAYGGWEHNLRIANHEVEALVTLDVGPRILRYGPLDGVNLLAELPEQSGSSGESRWLMRGGHRLWLAPEDPEYTYTPDNGPVRHEVDGTRVTVRNAPDGWGIEKSMTVELANTGSALRVIHRLRNHGVLPRAVSPWALTVMAAGGVAVVPLARRRPHPEDESRACAADFAPNQTLALWSYFDFTDPRFIPGRAFLRLRQDAEVAQKLGPTKFGLRMGFESEPGLPSSPWAAYINRGHAFIKRFVRVDGARFPDGDCNFECYTDASMLELESLGALGVLGPGQEVAHEESWSLHSVAEHAQTTEHPAFPNADASAVGYFTNAPESQIFTFFSRIFAQVDHKFG